jgi:hypothetical protein
MILALHTYVKMKTYYYKIKNLKNKLLSISKICKRFLDKTKHYAKIYNNKKSSNKISILDMIIRKNVK